jgi:hypothetical protein
MGFIARAFTPPGGGGAAPAVPPIAPPPPPANPAVSGAAMGRPGMGRRAGQLTVLGDVGGTVPQQSTGGTLLGS